MIAFKKMKGAMSDRYVEHGSDINVEHAYTMVRVESFLFNYEEASDELWYASELWNDDKCP